MQNKKLNAKQLQSKGKKKVTVNGRDYEIVMNFGVMGELEELYGNINTAMKEINNGKIKAMTNLMYAVMVQEEGNEDLTPRKVGKMLDMDFINELTKISDAVIESMPQDDGNNEAGEK